MAEWFSLEVLNGPTSAQQWSDAYGDALVQAGLSSGAAGYEWHRHSWGVVLEIEFADEAAFERFRNMPVVTAALDEVPDPVNGLLIHRGRGGSAGARNPRRPTPLRGSGAAELSIPQVEKESDELIARILAEERHILDWERTRTVR